MTKNALRKAEYQQRNDWKVKYLNFDAAKAFFVGDNIIFFCWLLIFLIYSSSFFHVLDFTIQSGTSSDYLEVSVDLNIHIIKCADLVLTYSWFDISFISGLLRN